MSGSRSNPVAPTERFKSRYKALGYFILLSFACIQEWRQIKKQNSRNEKALKVSKWSISGLHSNFVVPSKK